MLMIEKIFSNSEKKLFELSEALELLPFIYYITEKSHIKVKKLINNIEAIKMDNPVRVAEIEKEIETIVSIWQNKLKKLGVVPKGMWLADFDNGQGYYCWKFPEVSISHYHGYNDGFSGRIKIQ